MVKKDKTIIIIQDMIIHTPTESPDCVANKNDALKNI
jgi:hypothetical protein